MKLNYKTLGQGPALILLHGLFGSLDNWITHARALAEDFSVFLIDQRNHGKSPHADTWNYAAMAEDLHDFMVEHGIMQAHLLGHSMGGKTVMQFAAWYPEMIDRLIVADMAPKAYEPHHEAIIAALQAVPVGEMASRQEAAGLLEKKITEASIRQFLLKSLVRNDDKGYHWRFNLEVIARDYEAVLANVALDFPFEGPTLFLYGRNSSFLVPDKDKYMILEHFPQAQFEGLAAGHWLHAEAPEAFLAAVKKFLA
jgi:esterase